MNNVITKNQSTSYILTGIKRLIIVFCFLLSTNFYHIISIYFLKIRISSILNSLSSCSSKYWIYVLNLLKPSCVIIAKLSLSDLLLSNLTLLCSSSKTKCIISILISAYSIEIVKSIIFKYLFNSNKKDSS